MKLKIKLPLLLILLASAPLLLLGTVAFVKLKHAAEQSSITQVTKYLEQIISQTDGIVTTAQANIELIAGESLLSNYIFTEDEEERYSLMLRPLLLKLKNIMHVFPQYYGIRLIQPDGFEDIRLTSPFIPNQTEEEKGNVLFTSIVQEKNNDHLQFMTNPDNGQFSLYVSKRIDIINEAVDPFTAHPKVRGYLVLTVSLDTLKDVITDSPWRGGRFLITDQSGAIVLPYSDQAAHDLITNGLILKQDQMTDTTFSIIEIDGDRFYHTSHQMQHKLWIHALLPEKTLLQNSRNVSMLVIVIAIISALISVPLMIFISHSQILRPLKQLHQAFLYLGNNKDLVQVDTPGNDEINELGREFNRMSHKLFTSNKKIIELAYNDSLTGLPNRFMFTQYLNRAIQVAKNDNSQLAIMFIDLDNFKHINDSLGHNSGDQLLQEIATRLRENMRKKDFIGYFSDRDMVARLGGDEFTVLLVDLPSKEMAEQVAKRILDTVALPVTICGKKYYVSASIGITFYPENGMTAQELVKNADIAMYHAKNTGKSAYHSFTDILSQKNNEYSTIEQKMHEAIEHEVFELYFQPIVDCKNNNIVSLEALIRWSDPELGFISPDKFIPLAESNGLITAIGDWVIRAACHQLKCWQDMGIVDVKVAINVSAIQLSNLNFSEELNNYIVKSGIIPGSLYIELTETAIINNEQGVLATLNKLRDLNIKIALDDFGTGYSSLSYLKNLPIDILKIDRAFICEINNTNSNVILSAVITMAHALGFKVIAEGIEEPEHLVFLLKEGCDMLQGYMFSRPKPAAEITLLLLNDLEMRSRLEVSSEVPDYF